MPVPFEPLDVKEFCTRLEPPVRPPMVEVNASTFLEARPLKPESRLTLADALSVRAGTGRLTSSESLIILRLTRTYRRD